MSADDSYSWHLLRPDAAFLPMVEAAVVVDGRLDVEATIEALGEAGIGFAKREPREPDEQGEVKHEPVCRVCSQEWPCRHDRIEREAKRVQWNAESTCARCGGHQGWTIKVPGGGEFGLADAVYHGKKGACRAMALAEMQRLGLTDLHVKTVAMLARHDRTYWVDARRRRLVKEGMSRQDARTLAIRQYDDANRAPDTGAELPLATPLPHAGGPRVNPGSREVESTENTSNHGENPVHGEGEQS